MNKKVDNTLIIFKDHTASGGLYLSCFVYFLFFTVSFTWLIGMYTEMYRVDGDFIIGMIILSSLSLLFGWRVVSKILSIVDISKEKPLIRVNTEGIAILGDKFRSWMDIKQLRLITDFNVKFIELECFIQEENMNYLLYAPSETHEFKHLPELKNILDQYTEKISISEY